MAVSTQRESPLLGEIEGLRAVAVASVLLYHAGFGFSGGYVGVDVFFVVSGFLITSLLRREHESTHRISLRNFYARRARRLLPTATLVLLVTLVLADWLLDPVRAHQTATDTLWAGGFLANFHFAAVGADYLQATRPPSLLQHWWSLAVEEQFYVVWPGLLALTWRLGRNLTRAGVAVCLVVTGASLTLGVHLTRTNPVWGYFASWSRAWELALGALCAFAFAARHRLPWRSLLGWLGLAAIGYSIFRFDAATPFPGIAALVPVLGTVAVILSIGASGAPGQLLSLAPLQWIGGRSYGIYLWHWPLLMILHDRIDAPSVLQRAGVLVGAVALAALSFWLLENPLRHHPLLTRSARRSLIMGAVTIALVLGGAVIVGRATDDVHFSTGYVAPTAASTSASTSTTTATSTTAETASTVPPPSWQQQLDAKIAQELQPLIAASATNDLLPENITPPVSKQAGDDFGIWTDGCLVSFSGTSPSGCQRGDVGAPLAITIFGDSHVTQWFTGLEAAATEQHWRLDVVAKKICSAATMSVMRDKATTYPACDKWRANSIAAIAASDTQLVIINQWRKHYFRNVGGQLRSISDATWAAALEHTITTLTAAGKKVLLLSDTPIAGRQVDRCLASRPRHISGCNLSVTRNVDTRENELDRDLAARTGALFYDTSDWFCSADVCPAVIGNMAVYLDTNHINNTYSLFLAPYLTLLVKASLEVT